MMVHERTILRVCRALSHLPLTNHLLILLYYIEFLSEIITHYRTEI